MKIEVPVKYARQYGKIDEDFERHIERSLYAYREDDSVKLDISLMLPEQLAAFHKLLVDANDDALKHSLNRLAVYNNIKSDPDNHNVNTDLQALPIALKLYIEKNSKRRWLFKMTNDNMRLPYLVTGISYEPPSEHYAAHVTITLDYRYLDDKRKETITIYQHHLQQAGSKKSAKLKTFEVFDKFGYIIGEDILCGVYDKELEVFLKYRGMIGEQFISDGFGVDMDRYSGRRGGTMFNTDGVHHKLVVDEPSEVTADDVYTSNKFWDADKDAGVMVPVHPYIRVFNLREHRRYSVHTATLTPYAYKPELIHKLILPDEVKELVEILGNGTREGLGDIISGKAEGVIIGCVGAPGLGKSLTAEIYSEFLKRPLYTVQCSQLGTEPDDLEKKLGAVLENAARWGAVLLLDEADVYIRARGTDLIQNAIVGVFLRVLEYYKGIIFMTSNVLHLDDAIESRFTAKIVYPHPDKNAATQIWKDQMENHGWAIDEKFIEIMVDKYPQLSGRSIRSLLKLATLLARFRKVSGLSLEILEHSAKFAVHERKDKS